MTEALAISMIQTTLSMLRLMCVFIVSIIAFTCLAEKIDNTHYRFCIMDDAEITDFDCLEAYNNNQKPHYVYKNRWSSGSGVIIKAYKNYKDEWIHTDAKQIETLDNVTSIKVQMTEPSDARVWCLTHDWYKKVSNTEDQVQHTYIYITVQAPSGVSLEDIPSRALVGDEIAYTSKLEGTFPPPQYGITYRFSSSNENVATVSGTKITALNTGKATISVEASITNQRYGGYYYIGTATAEIEVVDNLDPTDISLSSQDFSLDIGQEKTISATLTPDDARTEITWSSSDNSVVTVDEGVVKAVGRGNAFVEATTSNGLSAKCYVTVLGDEDYHNVCIDGLYYDLDRKKNTAAIVHENPDQNNSYISGAVAIPEKVQFYGVDYTVTKIDVGAFFNCEITSVKLPETIKVIEFWAFSQTLLEEIELPQGLIEIGKEAFRLTNLESIIIGPNVAKIGEGAFANCRNLKAVYVDEGNPHYVIYNSCLYNAAKTKLYYVPIGQPEVDFPEGLETIGANALESNKVVTSVKFPETLIDIDNHAFYGCVSIEKLSFPNSLLEIGSYAFDGCDNLEEINFGSKLKIIGKSAFFTWNKNLKVVRISALNPPTADDSFHGCYGATLVVPLGRVSTYKKDSVWGKFAKITDDEDALSSVDGNMWGDDSNGNKFDVYSLQGILLRQDLTKDEINNLPSGLYLVNGEKFIVK